MTLVRRACVGMPVAVLLATWAGCGGPDADPEEALRLVCGEDADIDSAEPDSDPDGLVDGPISTCDVDRGYAEAVRWARDGLDNTDGEAMEFESGNGDVAVWAFLETDDDGGGVSVTVFPEYLRDADPDLLDPLAEDGWALSTD